MILSLIEPTNAKTLALSENQTWNGDSILVTPDLVGTWKILARVLQTTKQFSNSVAFRFRIGDKPLFARIPGFPTPKTELEPVKSVPTGILQVNARASACGSILPLNAGFSIAGKYYQAPASLKLVPGQYVVQPDQLAGSSVQAVSVSVQADKISTVQPLYMVALKLEVQPRSREVLAGQASFLEVQVTTAFAAFVPVNLKVTSSAGITVSPVIRGQTSSTKPFSQRLNFKTSASGKIDISLGAGCPSLEIPVKLAQINPPVVIPAKLTIRKTVDRNEVSVGETVNFTITVKNIGGSGVLGIKLSDIMPNGTSGENLQTTIDLKAGEARVFQVPSTVSSDAKGVIRNTVTLEGNNQNLSASASVRIKPAPRPMPEPRAPAARLSLTKTVDRFEVKRGETVNFTITAKNNGGTTATNVRVQDVLPAGLEAANLDTNIDLKPGEARVFEITAKISSDATGFIRNTATLEGNNQNLSASARVHVNVPPPEKPVKLVQVVVKPAQLKLEKQLTKKCHDGSNREFHDHRAEYWSFERHWYQAFRSDARRFSSRKPRANI